MLWITSGTFNGHVMREVVWWILLSKTWNKSIRYLQYSTYNLAMLDFSHCHTATVSLLFTVIPDFDMFIQHFNSTLVVTSHKTNKSSVFSPQRTSTPERTVECKGCRCNVTTKVLVKCCISNVCSTWQSPWNVTSHQRELKNQIIQLKSCRWRSISPWMTVSFVFMCITSCHLFLMCKYAYLDFGCVP